MSPALPFLQAFPRLSLLAKLNLVAIVAGVVTLSFRLWPQWRNNPDLSHGLFMPFLFVFLIHESRANGTPRFLRSGPLAGLGFGVTLALALLTLTAAGLYAAAVDWSHALVNFMLAVSLAFFLGAAVFAYSSERVRFIGFNWPAVMAAVLWLLSAPIPPGTYTRLTLALQLWVSEAVLRTLHVLGIAAIRHGNIIEMANATVGVEEACSGIRSLISCVFAGLFFSATLVRRPIARAVIIVLAAPLALVMNFLRSLALTLLANNGIDIAGTWHDATGFAVLGITAAMLGGLALLLERGSRTELRAPDAADVSRVPGTQIAFSGGLLVAAALVALFVTNTRPSIRRDMPVPDLMALLPANPPGWQVTTTDLYEFTGTLQTEYLAQRRYIKPTATDPLHVTIYVAYWRAGQAPVSLVATHTPDACWPGSGWTSIPTREPRATLNAAGRQIFDAEYRLFKTGDYPQHVWYWHLYDGRPILYNNPYSPTELLRIALRFGFRHDGDQLFVRVSSNRPWEQIAGEPLLADFFGRTQMLGL